MKPPLNETTAISPVLNCLECGADISADAKGLCPRCLLKLGLASQLSPGFIETGVAPPPFLGFDSVDPSKRTVIEPFEFGGYRIFRLLGKGGMGAVYEAEELASGRRVALKVLGQSLDSEDTRKRFIREGRIAASINHPNSVYVYGTEEIEGAPVITMELVPGGTLHERVKEGGAMPIAEAVDAILQIIAGLEAAHAVGILHRDIKPSNCFIEPSGTVKVGDFGLSISTLSRGDSALTLAGSILGTPEFSSPEQLRGEELNVRSDIYSVGMTLYYLLTGKTAFRGENVVQLLATVLEKAPQPPREVRPEIPEALSRIILRCLAKQAAERPVSYDELRCALLPFNSMAPTPATLGLRFVAYVIDHITITAANLLVGLIMANFIALSDLATSRTPEWIGIGMLLFHIAYFAVTEGLWGASLGKAVFGLRVVGLDRNAPGIPRAALRAVIDVVPLILAVLAFLVFRNGGNTLPAAGWMIAVEISFLAFPALLALSARRSNGFATVMDLLTKTRVIRKVAPETRETGTQAVEPITMTDATPKLGPYFVLATLAATESDELLLSYDAKLLRRLWIRKVRAGTAPVSTALRNVARPGRLRWLQGHRTEIESWDAYEFVAGLPLVDLLRTPQPWKCVRFWLLDLAAEFAASTRDGSLPTVLSLDRVWITSGGRAKLLDFPAPGAKEGAEPMPEPHTFLNQIAISALEGRNVSAEEARTREPRLPVPIPARGVLLELRSAPDFTALTALLAPLTHQVPHVTRRRRLGLIAGCVVPALVAALFMFGELKTLEAWLQIKPTMVSPGSPVISPSGKNPQIGIKQAKISSAAHSGKPILDPKGHLSRTPDVDITDSELARFALLLCGGAFIGTFIWAAFFSAVCALLFRGGLLLRAFGIAVVRTDGSDASRLRMLWRACVAWAWLPPAFAVFVQFGFTAPSAIVVSLILALIAYSAVQPERSLQDRIAGSWLVPR